MTKVTLPELGEGVKSAVVSYWHFDAGDKVNEGDDLVEMATDKATFNVPAPVSGKLAETNVEEGDTAQVGDTLAVIEEEE
jgi:pyruvate dehydrogenase E2 component (dihydrolipoamide acetyltransferase)